MVIPCLDSVASAVPSVLRGLPSAKLSTTSVCCSGIPLACEISRAVTLAPVSGRIWIVNGFDFFPVNSTVNSTVSKGTNLGATELTLAPLFLDIWAFSSFEMAALFLASTLEMCSWSLAEFCFSVLRLILVSFSKMNLSFSLYGNADLNSDSNSNSKLDQFVLFVAITDFRVPLTEFETALVFWLVPVCFGWRQTGAMWPILLQFMHVLSLNQQSAWSWLFLPHL